MTRRERRGSIVVLVLIALLLAITALVRSCRTSVVIPAEQLQSFERQTDTATVVMGDRQSASKKRTKAPVAKRKPKSKPAKSKPSPEPRRMDPVPQF
ncbi:MAG: hypothetical protein J5503_03295 [Muribaculaceae bacterium]|nr:hypothetical protein [Muribaculaceae bacterium]